MTRRVRVLCLGNDLLGDDGLGQAVAGALIPLAGPGVDVVYAPSAGFALLDHVTGVDHLLLIDTVWTGTAPPGTLYEFQEADLQIPAGPSPHYIGLREVLQLARALDLGAPEAIAVLAVEAADCTTVGGPMHAAVRESVVAVCDRARKVITGWMEVEHA